MSSRRQQMQIIDDQEDEQQWQHDKRNWALSYEVKLLTRYIKKQINNLKIQLPELSKLIEMLEQQRYPFQSYSYIYQNKQNSIQEDMYQKQCYLCKKRLDKVQSKFKDFDKVTQEKISQVNSLNREYSSDYELVFHIIIQHSGDNDLVFQLDVNKSQLKIKINEAKEKQSLENKYICIQNIQQQKQQYEGDKFMLNVFKSKGKNVKTEKIFQKYLKFMLNRIKIAPCYAEIQPIIEQESLSQQQQSQDRESYINSMKNRKLYHSKYFNKITEEELDIESENDDDSDEFINNLEKKEIESKEELYPKDQELFSLWNTFIQKKQSDAKKTQIVNEMTIRNFPVLFSEFVALNKRLLRDKLYNQFFQFLCTLFQQGLVDQNFIFTQVMIVKETAV